MCTIWKLLKGRESGFKPEFFWSVWYLSQKVVENGVVHNWWFLKLYWRQNQILQNCYYFFQMSHGYLPYLIFQEKLINKIYQIQTFALNKIIHHWCLQKLPERENSSSLKLWNKKFCRHLKSDRVGNCSQKLEFSAPVDRIFGLLWPFFLILLCKKQ